MYSEKRPHRAGFIHIVGRPNAGKSTLFNQLVRYPLSIVSPKPQTTRQNIIGIDQGEDYQAIYLDTPGYLEPKYGLQAMMMRAVKRALVDYDLLVWVVDITAELEDAFFCEEVAKLKGPLFVLLNKQDLVDPTLSMLHQAKWQGKLPAHVKLMPISALDKDEVAKCAAQLVGQLPIHPPYYDKDELTDHAERFFAEELIRKALFMHYKQEIPYSSEVVVVAFQEEDQLLRIDAEIWVERPTQKRIMIGRGGSALKVMGTAARQALEDFFKKKVFLSQYVKVVPDWRNKKEQLRARGYR